MPRHYAKSESIVPLKTAFRCKFNEDPPLHKQIHSWYKKFVEDGCICKGKSTGRPLTTRLSQPHSHHEVLQYLNVTITGRWIGRSGEEDLFHLKWPPRSPDLIPRDFYMWDYIKDSVYVPPMPATLQDLRDRIVTAVSLITRDQ
ncbi:hypothetical protein AVEN_1851-1 [Araneus ventricosus]|uniref:DUF4817 domain-containing protein n=1 Tax=Araneus ventricosus TaxID=182803 RepID=A0A4Y2M9F7_ARAVE|nr:hypothetical protein AVEN_49533-1 [Araneus ventricosus]GBN22297.1 hypothetical protein AVEN_1851-1 [Araneus ventricosus]